MIPTSLTGQRKCFSDRNALLKSQKSKKRILLLTDIAIAKIEKCNRDGLTECDMVQIGYRLGLYNPDELKDQDLVFDTDGEFIKHHGW